MIKSVLLAESGIAGREGREEVLDVLIRLHEIAIEEARVDARRDALVKELYELLDGYPPCNTEKKR